MQGAQKLRSEAYFHVRCNDEVEAQRSRWTFYETIKTGFFNLGVPFYESRFPSQFKNAFYRGKPLSLIFSMIFFFPKPSTMAALTKSVHIHYYYPCETIMLRGWRF
jgi:hypothetical protein